ncbi:MAG: MBL fold metallo-hydrolase [Bacteroidales bacterium]
MIKIKALPYNALEVNTYIVSDETLECVIIDPACEYESELKALLAYIDENQLKPVHILITHPHIDHILSTEKLCTQYHLPLEMHIDGKAILEDAPLHASVFGFHLNALPKEYLYIGDKDKIQFGHSELEARYVPGHCDGSLCFVAHADKTVFSGDVLFYGSIGRSDLPTGDYDQLKKSIHEQLFTLADDFTVRPGHGGRTTIEHERKHNPFLG